MVIFQGTPPTPTEKPRNAQNRRLSHFRDFFIHFFRNYMDVSKNEENPLKMDDLGVPIILGNYHLKWMFKGYQIFFPT